MESNYNIKSAGIDSDIAYGPFDKAKEKLENKEYRIISLEENARLRILQGKNADISRKGNRTREAFIYDKQRGIYLSKNSPIMENAKEATQSNRSGNEYFLTAEQVEQALQDSVRIPAGLISIPTNRFGEDITSYAFGCIAEDYGLFLEDAGIEKMPICLTHTSDKPFARQMWFRSLDGRSELDGYNRDLCGDYGGGVRGMKGTDFVGSQNLEGIVKETKTPRQKNDFKKKFYNLSLITKTIDLLVKNEHYEEAQRLAIERANLYKELDSELSSIKINDQGKIIN